MKASKLAAAAVFGGLSAVTGLIGGRIADRPKDKLWYRLLRKPPHTPPDWVFSVMWSALYALGAYSGYRAWQHRREPGAKTALSLWGTQLAFNGAWTPLFFGQHRSRAALVDLYLNLASSIAYTQRVASLDRKAAAAMLPYVAWLGFASTINRGIVRRNPRLLAG
jgi:tryptophan-rich sensory protein